MSSEVLRVDALTVRFAAATGPVHALNGVSVTVHPGEAVGILGESGSGKSVLLRSIMRLLPTTAELSGRIRLAGHDVLGADPQTLRSLRGPGAAMVFQEPGMALDPLYPIGRQIEESILAHLRIARHEARQEALALLERVHMPSPRIRLGAFPHELSGGMRQRAMIAVALAARPQLLLADEPTTALDPSVQIQVLLLLRELQRTLQMAVLFVSHDIHAAGLVCDRILVMYGGTVVEEGPVSALLHAPRHPYTARLLAATVTPEHRGRPLPSIPGTPPVLVSTPSDCPFRSRCPRADEACLIRPQLLEVGAAHHVACHHMEPPLH